MDREVKSPVYVFTVDGYRSLRASRLIRQGETILEIPKITKDQPDQFSIQVAPGVHADCAKSPVGATNHSCRPNAAVKDWRLVAWACIQPGEDVTIDYRRTETQLSVPFDCLCGAKECQGRIE